MWLAPGKAGTDLVNVGLGAAQVQEMIKKQGGETMFATTALSLHLRPRLPLMLRKNGGQNIHGLHQFLLRQRANPIRIALIGRPSAWTKDGAGNEQTTRSAAVLMATKG